MLFVWDNDFNTGIDKIDHDHKALVKLINDLYEAMQDGSGGALLLPILSALKHYTETHFAEEESYMVECNASDQEKHFKEHRLMVTKLADLEKGIVAAKQLSPCRPWLFYETGSKIIYALSTRQWRLN